MGEAGREAAMLRWKKKIMVKNLSKRYLMDENKSCDY
jgi:hypothetical protein